MQYETASDRISSHNNKIPTITLLSVIKLRGNSILSPALRHCVYYPVGIEPCTWNWPLTSI